MKKILLTLLGVIVILGALAGVGFAGYRIGYNQGAVASGNAPAFGHFQQMDPHEMPMQRFGDGFGPRSQQFHAPMMMGRGGFRSFSPFHFIWNIVVLGLVIWFVYWLFTKSGWQISRKAETTKTTEKTE